MKEVRENTEELLQKMREEGLPVVHSLFATIHIRSEQRPDGYTEQKLSEIAVRLQEQDVERWKEELKAHGAVQLIST